MPQQFADVLQIAALSQAMGSERVAQGVRGDVLADTGADLSVLPKSLGILIVGDIREGKKYRITGLAGYSKYIYLHRLTTKIGRKKIKAAFAF